jgi:hypothetical protein
LAFSQWVAIAHLPSGPSAHKPNSGRHYHQTQANQPTSIGESKKAGAYDPGCPYPKGREDADLCEQRRMAKAAEESVALAVSQWWVNIIQAAATIMAALAAGWAAYEAGRAARGSEQSAKIAADALHKLERAFVVFKQMHRTGDAYRLDDAPGDDVRDKQFVPIAVELENSGATPTRGLRAQINFARFGKNGMPVNFAFPDVEADNDPVTFVIGPRATSRLASFGISFTTLELVHKGDAQGYMWGWVEYDDTFSDTPRRRTEFCFRISKIILPISKPGMEWDAHTQHNGMDEDCPTERWQTIRGGAFKLPRRPKITRG